MPIPPKTSSRVFRTAPAKAALAVGGAAVAACALLAFPATASAASGSANLIIRPRPSFSFPVLPSTQVSTSFPTSGDSTTVPVGVKKPSAPKQSEQPQFNYVSTFSPQPAATSAPANTASASCIANGQSVSGPGGDLDLPGINGTSQDPGHSGALPIKSLGPARMLPPQIDSTNLGQLKVTRPVDATSANLSMVASSGYRFPCVHIEIGPGQGFANAEYALVNAGLVADDRSGSVETLTWTYSTILWSYTLPGSTTVHQGSGEINAQPDRTTTSLVTDSKAVAAGTIGLTLVVSLGLLALYIIGRRRNKARYRARYYRRAAMRAERDGVAAAPVSAMQAVEPAEPAGIWEPQPSEAAGLVEASEVAEAGEAVEAAEVPETLHEPQPEAEREPEAEAEAEAGEPGAEREPEAVPAPEAAEAPEVAEESELAEESESALEPEAEPDLEPEQEADQEPAVEPEQEPEPESVAAAEPDRPVEQEATEPEAESTESDVAEAEAEPEAEIEPKAEAASEPKAEAVSEPKAESEPVTEAVDGKADAADQPDEPVKAADSAKPEASAKPEDPAEPEASAEPEERPKPEEPAKAEAPAQPEESTKAEAPAKAEEPESSQEPSESQAAPAPGDEHEPAAAR